MWQHIYACFCWLVSNLQHLIRSSRMMKSHRNNINREAAHHHQKMKLAINKNNQQRKVLSSTHLPMMMISCLIIPLPAIVSNILYLMTLTITLFLIIDAKKFAYELLWGGVFIVAITVFFIGKNKNDTIAVTWKRAVSEVIS